MSTPAEFGHEATQVNVVSKSGTNTYHGSMYDFIRNNTADANPYWFPYNATPLKVYPFKWNDYGFELRRRHQNSQTLQRQRQILLHG